MTENRICPVCEKEIPLDAKYYYCPYCFYFFDRIGKKLNDEKAIETAKKNFTGKIFTTGKQHKLNSDKSTGANKPAISLVHQQAKKVYRWLWWSPLLTIPTLAFLFNMDPGYELFCINYAICDWDKAERLTILVAILGSSLWHLTLLKHARNKDSFFVRWHGRQALALAGLRTATPLILSQLFVYGGLVISFLLLIGIWLFGTIWGQNQTKTGVCTLARWFGHSDELPGPPVESVEPSASPLSAEENEIETLVDVIRFSQNKTERANALSKLRTLGVVEEL